MAIGRGGSREHILIAEGSPLALLAQNFRFQRMNLEMSDHSLQSHLDENSKTDDP